MIMPRERCSLLQGSPASWSSRCTNGANPLRTMDCSINRRLDASHVHAEQMSSQSRVSVNLRILRLCVWHGGATVSLVTR